jgi:cephalosporin hydroxylase
MGVLRVDLQGWFGSDEAECYKSLVRGIHGGVVVEVGCWKGLSTSYVGKMCNDNGTRLVVVDTFKGSESDESDGLAKKESIKDIFVNNMRELGIEYSLLEMPSVEASRFFDNESVTLVMLDANHEYGHVLADLRAWWPKVKPYGWMCGHDVSKEGVSRALGEFFGVGRYEVLSSHVGPCWWQKRGPIV